MSNPTYQIINNIGQVPAQAGLIHQIDIIGAGGNGSNNNVNSGNGGGSGLLISFVVNNASDNIDSTKITVNQIGIGGGTQSQRYTDITIAISPTVNIHIQAGGGFDATSKSGGNGGNILITDLGGFPGTITKTLSSGGGVGNNIVEFYSSNPGGMGYQGINNGSAGSSSLNGGMGGNGGGASNFNGIGFMPLVQSCPLGFCIGSYLIGGAGGGGILPIDKTDTGYSCGGVLGNGINGLSYGGGGSLVNPIPFGIGSNGAVLLYIASTN
jgi:hypothetical protein